MKLNSKNWTAQQSATVYGINDWGRGYFAVNEQGEIIVRAPVGKGAVQAVSLKEIAAGLEQRGLNMPLLLRLENLVDDRIRALNESFGMAIKKLGFQGNYRGAFPIKVNQQSHVISEIARYGQQYHHGFEVGSKAELLVALALMTDRESLIICNGYKDAEFIELGLQARILGFRCFFVVENPAEVPIILDRSLAMGVEPMIGARVKLATQVEGHWSKDSGDRSLFGLNTSQLVEVIDLLKSAGKLSCFELLHFHLGSQIPNISNIRTGVQEACRYYVNLVREGAPMGYFDIGGGLAVDYDGTRSTRGYSRNYTLSEYCEDVVEAIQTVFDQEQVPHPTIVSESGRATVAHTAVLLFNIFDVNRFVPGPLPKPLPQDLPDPVANLLEVSNNMNVTRIQEYYNDIIFYRNQAMELFTRGEIDLRVRALVENLYLTGLQRVVAELPRLKRIPEEMEVLADQLSDIYYGNFSVFQSLPDSWAINQVFPVVPIHRLNEQPTRHGVLADITCDCDGKLNLFSNMDGYTTTLPLHDLKDDEEYLVGVFLVGAYQETLGDLHNLFGDTNIASIRVNPDGSYDVVHEFEGDTIADVLSYVEYDPPDMLKTFRAKAERAVKEGRITVAQRQQMLGMFTESLRGYTYFEK